MKSVLGMWVNWRVLVGLGATALAVWMLGPQYIGAAVPLLLALACPVSMVVMMVMMRGPMTAGPKRSPTERLAALEHERTRLLSKLAEARTEPAGAAVHATPARHEGVVRPGAAPTSVIGYSGTRRRF